MLSKFMGGSDRPQHLLLNRIVAVIITAADIALTQNPVGLITGLACLLMEWWATPDRDIEHKRGQRFGHRWWLIYEWFIPNHRHPLSHSLLLGLPLRLLWGTWPLLLMYLSQDPLWEILQTPWMVRVLLGAIASDCCHYALDGYWPHQMLLGK